MFSPIVRRKVPLIVGRPPHFDCAPLQIEDLIADRLGQHAVASPTDDSRLRQARSLFLLGQDIDLAYLRRQVTEEGGDPALLDPFSEQ